MKSLYRKPGPPLDRFVELLWYFECGPQAHPFERLLPTGTVELIINLAQDENAIFDTEDTTRVETREAGLVCGPQTSYFLIETSLPTRVAGVHFRPGGSFPFMRPPAHEFLDRRVSLGDVWGTAAVSLRDRLLEAPSAEAILDALGEALRERAARPLEGHAAVRYALRELDRVPHTRTIADLTAQIGLSARRFIDVFTAEVGLRPKAYCRIRRFQEVVRRVHSGRWIDWTSVAMDCGYFDQAHFIRDFRAFSGLNPSTYLAIRGEHQNHVPVHD